MPADRRIERQTGLRLALEAEGLDGLVITHLPNIRYLTGFTGSAAVLLVRNDATVLVSDFRYAAQAPAEVGGSAVVEIDQRSVWDRLGRVLHDDRIERLGIEAHVMSVKDAERLSGLTPARLVPTGELVERQREVKSPDEVAAIRSAAELAQEALAEVLPRIRVGQTELEIGSELERVLRQRGSQWHPFPTIVASGQRSALPHARTSPRPVDAGRPSAGGLRCAGGWVLRRSDPNHGGGGQGRRAATVDSRGGAVGSTKGYRAPETRE